MDDEIKTYVGSLLDERRQSGYESAMKLLGSPFYTEKRGGDGRSYQVHMDAFYDDKSAKTIRVVLSVYKSENKKWWQRLLKPVETPIYTEDYIATHKN